ncbi:glutathione S-transferase [Flagelloscypha sp. PMI_526]|nr:glutathione S-transferase [Flagelloscypha sp. PMI_526]
MVLKLYAFAHSTCGKRVATVLHEKAVPFEFISVDTMKGEHKTPEFLKNQPFGQVPYIDDDGFILYESRAITRYICEKYPSQGTQLIPAGLKEKALFEQAASNETFNFDPFCSAAVSEAVFKPMIGRGEPDKAIVEGLVEKLSAKLDAYDKILSAQKYLAGNELTLADLAHLPYGTLLGVAGYDVLTSDAKPNVARWWKDLQARPSWQAVTGGIQSNL